MPGEENSGLISDFFSHSEMVVWCSSGLNMPLILLEKNFRNFWNKSRNNVHLSHITGD